MKENKILFYEKQHLTQWWLWLTVIVVQLIPVVMQYMKLSAADMLDNPKFVLSIFGTNLAVFILSAIFIYSIKLETKITDKFVYVRLFPFGFSFKAHSFGEMLACYVRKYRPIREYGGWGVKGTFNNRALNISGNNGLQIEFKNGKKLLIGTRKPQEIIEVLKLLQNNTK